MMRLTALAAFVMVAVLASTVIAQPAPGPAAPGPAPGVAPPGPGLGGAMGPQPGSGQILERLAERLGMSEAEKDAVKTAVRDKMEATRALAQELRALGQVARNQDATDQELRDALHKFQDARTAYRQRIEAIDAQLTGVLSPKSQAALTVLGVIDNGLGPRLGGAMRARAGQQRPMMRQRGGFGGLGAPAPVPQPEE